MILRRKQKIENLEEKKQNGWFVLSMRVFAALVIFFFAIFFTWYAIFLSSHGYYSVKGVSMMPTLNEKIDPNKFLDAQGISYDCVYVDKKTEPKIFDIIVINTHQTIIENGKKMTKTLIKRLMATEGDYISIAKTTNQDGTERMSFFRIPKEALPEDESSDQFKNFVIVDKNWQLEENGENGYEIYAPNSLWTHYDKPRTSTLNLEIEGVDKEKEYEYDFLSTYFQDLSTENIKNGDFKVSQDGLVYVRIPEGKFFYMGDNRAYSSDARNEGFRNFEDIVGSVEIVIYNNGLFTRIGTFMSYFFHEVEKFFAR